MTAEAAIIEFLKTRGGEENRKRIVAALTEKGYSRHVVYRNLHEMKRKGLLYWDSARETYATVGSTLAGRATRACFGRMTKARRARFQDWSRGGYYGGRGPCLKN